MSALLVVLAALLPAQAAGPVVTRDIRSSVLQETRRVLLQLPPGYDERGARFPVIYLLDGNLMIHSAPGAPNHAEIIAGLAEGGLIPEVIVVGIVNTDRTRDMTPTHVADRPTSGGADDFLRFLSEELVPFIDHEYRTASSRVLYGHSLAGLFTAHALLSSPGLFDGYIASSPGLSWDGDGILTRAEAAFASGWTEPAVLFFGIGEDDEYTAFVRATRAFEGLMSRVGPPQLTWRCRILAGEDHGSVVPINLKAGLVYLFGEGGLSKMPPDSWGGWR